MFRLEKVWCGVCDRRCCPMNDVLFWVLSARVHHRKTVLRFVRCVEILVMCCMLIRVNNMVQPSGMLLQLGIFIVLSVFLSVYLYNPTERSLIQSIQSIHQKIQSKEVHLRQVIEHHDIDMMQFLYKHGQFLDIECKRAFDVAFADEVLRPKIFKMMAHR